MFIFRDNLEQQDVLRERITQSYYDSEAHSVTVLLEKLNLSSSELDAITATTHSLVTEVRGQTKGKDTIDALMSHYDLSSAEGILLMCLAEALLRIPDKETEDLLIKDKLTSANWEAHLGKSESRFVNLMTWSLAFTGNIFSEQSNSHFIKKIWRGMLSRVSEPVVREAVRKMMKLMSEHFVLGRTIKEALARSKPLAAMGYTFSYDMLGEMARTPEQALVYFQAYREAILAVGDALNNQEDAFSAPTISIKLSALYPRYEFAKQHHCVPFLTDKLKQLALLAKSLGIHVTVDAEEAARLDISLDVFMAVCADDDLSGWSGLGLAVQAYQKRAYYVLEWLISEARALGKKIPVRLVKGAYWDTEIKIAQVEGYSGYPVFTRKCATDISYLACAKLMLASSDALYSKFATHNAYTVAAVMKMAEPLAVDFEFQNLQGMGGQLHHVLVSDPKYRCKSRIYAPVGKHEDLLPYLVRRLLENGANASFIHQIGNPNVPITELTESPVTKIKKYKEISNPHIPLPANIYPNGRINATGFDFTCIDRVNALMLDMSSFENHSFTARPAFYDKSAVKRRSVTSPNDLSDTVGEVILASKSDIVSAFDRAVHAFDDWEQVSVDHRAALLEKVACLMEASFAKLMTLMIREAGKTLHDAVAEIREAVDFCRYYAVTARNKLSPDVMPGPTGESNKLYYHGRGVMACISPWNFPLAIFTGQVAACLVAGNAVLAKPASQTPLVAAMVVDLFYQAGVPKPVLQLVPASGALVSETVIADERIAGVLFTGSTETAKAIACTLANRPGEIVPLIAETGGMNAMIVDSSALLEQVVEDVMQSAFGSAGQRCSALRILFVQEDVADAVLALLKGAMATWDLGFSGYLETDVGPVIDESAKTALNEYIDFMRSQAEIIAEMSLPENLSNGCFVAPIAFELPDLSLLKGEVFGPVLHVLRYKRDELDAVVQQINALKFGLTFGIQSRIDRTINYLIKHIRTGNIYVNRSMTGAVVGVQPFGGCGLSGTGPKAGGPNYLLRLCRETTVTINTTASGGNAELLALSD